MGKLGVLGAIAGISFAGTATYLGYNTVETQKAVPLQVEEAKETVLREPEKVSKSSSVIEISKAVPEKLKREDIMFCMTLRGNGDECMTRADLLKERSKPMMKKRAALRTGEKAGQETPGRI